jgi:multidrug efflux pump subunit AcrA (membrane-fusion protein)
MMRYSWMLAVAAGATLSMAVPTQGFAQDRSQAARARQEAEARAKEYEKDRGRVYDQAAKGREKAYEQARKDREKYEKERQKAAEQAMRDRERYERERQQINARERQRQLEIARQRARLEEERRRELERERMRREREYGRYDDYDNGRNGNAPAFCRSGAGHPVYGREWCRERGYGPGSGRWESTRWESILFRDQYVRRNQQLSRSALMNLLGSVALSRFESYGRQYGNGMMSGYWLPETSSNILQLSIGNVPIARLIDQNRDGRVDNVLLWR